MDTIDKSELDEVVRKRFGSDFKVWKIENGIVGIENDTIGYLKDWKIEDLKKMAEYKKATYRELKASLIEKGDIVNVIGGKYQGEIGDVLECISPDEFSVKIRDTGEVVTISNESLEKDFFLNWEKAIKEIKFKGNISKEAQFLKSIWITPEGETMEVQPNHAVWAKVHADELSEKYGVDKSKLTAVRTDERLSALLEAGFIRIQDAGDHINFQCWSIPESKKKIENFIYKHPEDKAIFVLEEPTKKTWRFKTKDVIEEGKLPLYEFMRITTLDRKKFVKIAYDLLKKGLWYNEVVRTLVKEYNLDGDEAQSIAREADDKLVDERWEELAPLRESVKQKEVTMRGSYMQLKGVGLKIANRIQIAIERTALKLEDISEEKKKELEEDLDIESYEFIAYQNAQAQAHAEGRITTEEAQRIYQILNKWNTASLPEKVTVTRVMGELMKTTASKKIAQVIKGRFLSYDDIKKLERGESIEGIPEKKTAQEKFEIGDKVQIGEGAGLYSGKTAEVIEKVDWRTIPGAYKDPGEDAVYLRLEDGEIEYTFPQYLKKISSKKTAQEEFEIGEKIKELENAGYNVTITPHTKRWWLSKGDEGIKILDAKKFNDAMREAWEFVFKNIDKKTGQANIRIFDNEGKSFDRYTVFIDEHVFGMSENALSPQGFNQYVGDTSEIEPGSHLGKEVKFEDLPEDVQKAIKDRMKTGSLKIEATIKKCKKEDLEPGKPWCLYTKSKPEKLLGKHESRKKAVKQEQAIKARGGSTKYYENRQSVAEIPDNILEHWLYHYLLYMKAKGLEPEVTEVSEINEDNLDHVFYHAEIYGDEKGFKLDGLDYIYGPATESEEGEEEIEAGKLGQNQEGGGIMTAQEKFSIHDTVEIIEGAGKGGVGEITQFASDENLYWVSFGDEVGVWCYPDNLRHSLKKPYKISPLEELTDAEIDTMIYISITKPVSYVDEDPVTEKGIKSLIEKGLAVEDKGWYSLTEKGHRDYLRRISSEKTAQGRKGYYIAWEESYLEPERRAEIAEKNVKTLKGLGCDLVNYEITDIPQQINYSLYSDKKEAFRNCVNQIITMRGDVLGNLIEFSALGLVVHDWNEVEKWLETSKEASHKRGNSEVYEMECPNCRTIFEVEESKVGKPPFDTECPECGELVGSEYIHRTFTSTKKVGQTVRQIEFEQWIQDEFAKQMFLGEDSKEMKIYWDYIKEEGKKMNLADEQIEGSIRRMKVLTIASIKSGYEEFEPAPEEFALSPGGKFIVTKDMDFYQEFRGPAWYLRPGPETEKTSKLKVSSGEGVFIDSVDSDFVYAKTELLPHAELPGARSMQFSLVVPIKDFYRNFRPAESKLGQEEFDLPPQGEFVATIPIDFYAESAEAMARLYPDLEYSSDSYYLYPKPETEKMTSLKVDPGTKVYIDSADSDFVYVKTELLPHAEDPGAPSMQFYLSIPRDDFYRNFRPTKTARAKVIEKDAEETAFAIAEDIEAGESKRWALAKNLGITAVPDKYVEMFDRALKVDPEFINTVIEKVNQLGYGVYASKLASPAIPEYIFTTLMDCVKEGKEFEECEKLIAEEFDGFGLSPKHYEEAVDNVEEEKKKGDKTLSCPSCKSKNVTLMRPRDIVNNMAEEWQCQECAQRFYVNETGMINVLDMPWTVLEEEKQKASRKIAKKWKVVLIDNGEQINKVIELGPMSNPIDVKEQLNRMGIKGEIISIKESSKKTAQEKFELGKFRINERVEILSGGRKGETGEIINIPSFPDFDEILVSLDTEPTIVECTEDMLKRISSRKTAQENLEIGDRIEYTHPAYKGITGKVVSIDDDIVVMDFDKPLKVDGTTLSGVKGLANEFKKLSTEGISKKTAQETPWTKEQIEREIEGLDEEGKKCSTPGCIWEIDQKISRLRSLLEKEKSQKTAQEKIYWKDIPPEDKVTLKGNEFYYNDKLVYWSGTEAIDAQESLLKMVEKKATQKLLGKWRERLQDVYDDFEEFEVFSEVYNIAGRLGYNTTKEAWEDNPMVEGSTDPADYKRVETIKTAQEDITITEVKVLRAEGLTEEVDITPRIYSTPEEADKRLVEISQTAPKDGGYNKTDVIIVFSDGETIGSRHDIEYGNTDGTVIGHALQFLNYYIDNPERAKAYNILEKGLAKMKKYRDVLMKYSHSASIKTARFEEGDKVELDPSYWTKFTMDPKLEKGDKGTVTTEGTFEGVWADPSHKMIMVQFDKGIRSGVEPDSLKKISSVSKEFHELLNSEIKTAQEDDLDRAMFDAIKFWKGKDIKKIPNGYEFTAIDRSILKSSEEKTWQLIKKGETIESSCAGEVRNTWTIEEFEGRFSGLHKEKEIEKLGQEQVMTFRELVQEDKGLLLIDYKETPISEVVERYGLEPIENMDYEYSDAKAYYNLGLKEKIGTDKEGVAFVEPPIPWSGKQYTGPLEDDWKKRKRVITKNPGFEEKHIIEHWNERFQQTGLGSHRQFKNS